MPTGTYIRFDFGIDIKDISECGTQDIQSYVIATN